MNMMDGTKAETTSKSLEKDIDEVPTMESSQAANDQLQESVDGGCGDDEKSALPSNANCDLDTTIRNDAGKDEVEKSDCQSEQKGTAEEQVEDPTSPNENENESLKENTQEMPNNEVNSVDNEADISGIDLTKPLRKARTAYFIFQQEKRNEVIDELSKTSSTDQENIETSASTSSTNKVPVPMIAKKIGELWSNLSIDEKEVYHAKARKEKESYEKVCNALIKAGISPSSMLTSSPTSTTKSKNENKNESDMIFPVSRIRKICRLDPDVKGMSKESTILITKAAEVFLGKMANDTWSMTKMHQKRTIHAQDVLDICSLKEMFFFLREDMKDLIQEQKDDKKRKRESKKLGQIVSNGHEEGTNKVLKSMQPSGVKPLTSYFVPTSMNK